MSNPNSSVSSNNSICFNTDIQRICLSVSPINANTNTNTSTSTSQTSNQNTPLVTQVSINLPQLGNGVNGPGQFYGAPSII